MKVYGISPKGLFLLVEKDGNYITPYGYDLIEGPPYYLNEEIMVLQLIQSNVTSNSASSDIVSNETEE